MSHTVRIRRLIIQPAVRRQRGAGRPLLAALVFSLLVWFVLALAVCVGTALLGGVW